MKKMALLVAAGAVGMAATGGGLWAVADREDTTAATASGNGGLAGGTGADAATGSGTSTTAGMAERPVSFLNFLRGKGPFTHQSDGMSVSMGTQSSCIRGDSWRMVAIFTVKDVTRTSAHIVKIVTKYSAPIPSKNVFLGAQNLWQDNGKHLLRNDVGNIVKIRGGRSLTQTIRVNKTVKFSGGYGVFQRRANIGQGTGEAGWCGGPGAMEVRFRPTA
ncbi:hypothetical protein [Actinomadura rudentiformis]|uniref:Uncharacterized protein n=1 Tax=Actinomadura rudentiformis TaxID=359158 RepID=A0A6H9YEZ8_9ACTN|nr:hypothetical protein [Actinomadura rudentiformis]KAB2340015.1 hypothetical protein F8566_46575 [Actinomadura rudentiformis]